VKSEDVYIVSDARKQAGSLRGDNTLASGTVPALKKSSGRTLSRWQIGTEMFPAGNPLRRTVGIEAVIAELTAVGNIRTQLA
jgi:hypothetical protein